MQDLRVYPTEFRDSSIANLDHWLMTQGRKRVCQGLCLLTRELPSPRVKEIRKKKVKVQNQFPGTEETVLKSFYLIIFSYYNVLAAWEATSRQIHLHTLLTKQVEA